MAEKKKEEKELFQEELFDEALDEISLENEKELRKPKTDSDVKEISSEKTADAVNVKKLKDMLFPIKEDKKIPVQKNVSEKSFEKKEDSSKKINSFLPLLIGFFGLIIFLAVVFLVFSFLTGLGSEVNSVKFKSDTIPVISDNSEENSLNEPQGKPECPFECCSDKIYIEKKCSAPLICSNNSCKLKPCTKECCTEENVQEKLCAEGMECVDNECLKPACPFICCMASDKEYREKKCISGLRCVGRTCSVPG
ncbi:MAG: hypothetical protein JW703_05285 [Candidatus Diapherotrites archaeon]|nr:hypothetical protein [Candidatus Diapherotrites archaeon]